MVQHEQQMALCFLHEGGIGVEIRGLDKPPKLDHSSGINKGEEVGRVIQTRTKLDVLYCAHVHIRKEPRADDILGHACEQLQPE